MLDLPLPGNDVLSEVQRLVSEPDRHERDPARPRSASSIRLVMNPERMVVKEAQRTFTYLNLYGYLTDAVVVNRVFPEDVEGGYFSAWREVQQEQIEFVEQAFAPVPVLRAPFFEQEVIGAEMLDAPGRGGVRATRARRSAPLPRPQPGAGDGRTAAPSCACAVPFAEKAEIELKKIGLELVVRVGGHKRNIMLPSALASYRPREAKLEDGALRVRFERQEPVADDRRPGGGLSRCRTIRSAAWATPRTTPSPRGRTGRRRRTAPAAPRAAGQLEHQCVDFCPICRTADVLRAAAPPEFQEHWHALQREGLLAARTLIDHYIRHLESQRASAVPVEDIPIE